MEEAFQDLLRLIEEAAYAWNTYRCSVTMRAYLKMAEIATFKLLAHTTDKDEEKRLRYACNYSQEFCLKQKKWEDVLQFMTKFWLGVEHGFFERTLLSNGGKYYKLGCKLGRFGP